MNEGGGGGAHEEMNSVCAQWLAWRGKQTCPWATVPTNREVLCLVCPVESTTLGHPPLTPETVEPILETHGGYSNANVDPGMSWRAGGTCRPTLLLTQGCFPITRARRVTCELGSCRAPHLFSGSVVIIQKLLKMHFHFAPHPVNTCQSRRSPVPHVCKFSAPPSPHPQVIGESVCWMTILAHPAEHPPPS
jgi:hypothetical protein